MLGIDGMDPGFVERHWQDLPNLDRLRRHGDFRRLGTTIPPQSPVAWSTFITGRDPSGHRIFDFVHRDPATMQPVSSMGETVESKHTLPLGPYRLPLSSGTVISFRKGTPFWQILSDRGIPSTVLRMPTNFPPVRCQCEELSGMGTPDMQGTFGTFTFYTDDPAESSREVPGGRIVLAGGGRDVQLTIEGPVNTLRKDRRRATVPLTLHLDATAKAARFDLPDQQFILRQGEWSDWIRLKFALIPGVKSTTGILRFYAQELVPHLRLYLSPINIDPSSPELAISVPGSYSREIVDKIGPFYTQGIAEDTAALRSGVFTLGDYQRQSRATAEEQVRVLRYALDRFRGGLFFMHFMGIDQNSHMLWGKHEPELLDTYRFFDHAIGYVMDRLPGATLIVMSDHGFAPFDRAVHLNTWLMREGFLTVDDTGAIDWPKTQAYGLGLNSIYLNLVGRERFGIVEREQAPTLLRVISKRLRDFRDPQSGQPVIADVYPATGPDLIVGYYPGYRTSWQSALGGVEEQTVEDNRDAWIGDHCIAPQFVPGVLFTKRPIRLADPQLADLTVTILDAFGVARPPDMAGRVVF